MSLTHRYPLYSRGCSSLTFADTFRLSLPFSFRLLNHNSSTFMTKRLPLSRKGKTICLLISFLFLSLFNPCKGLAQSASDQSAILKQCISLPALQEYYPVNSEGVKVTVHVLQFPFSFEPGLSVTMFGQPVIFQSRADVRTVNPDALLSFKTLSVKGESATAVFDFYHNRTSPSVTVTEITVDLQKGENGWTVTNSTLKK
jgi:hypothetical protein